MNVEQVEIASLKPHPRNYRVHTEEQLAHVRRSIEEHGFYRNVVVARGDVILAGHGVVQASTQLGMKTVPVVRLDVDADDPRAIKVLIGDNEIGKMAEVDDRSLTDMLKELCGDGDFEKLLGTGFDAQQLAVLAMVTRPASEISGPSAAAAWIGMPEFDQKNAEAFRTVHVHMKDQAAVDAFAAVVGRPLPVEIRYIWFPEIEIGWTRDKRYDAP